ncbi:hypothetical protein [Winogradskyella ouciana]|uniref:hypothetical protein n=1 Tax=Winogradskyella ouciana TaxID=2608631 RepID=UPI003D2E8895
MIRQFECHTKTVVYREHLELLLDTIPIKIGITRSDETIVIPAKAGIHFEIYNN